MEQERDGGSTVAQNGWTDLEDEAPLFPTRTRATGRVAGGVQEVTEAGDWEVESDIPALPEDPPAALMAFDDSSDDDIQDYRVMHRVSPPPKPSDPTPTGKATGVPANFFEDGSSSEGDGGEERIGNIGEEEVEEAAKMAEEQRQRRRFDGREATQRRSPPTEPPSRKRQALNLALLSDANSDTPMSELLSTKPIPHHVRPHTAAPKIMKRPGTAGEKYPYPNSVYSSPTEQASPNQSRLRITGAGAVRPMTAAQRARLPPALADDTRKDLHSTMYTEQERNRELIGLDEGTAGSPLRTVKALQQQQKPRPSYTRGNRRRLDAMGLPEPDTDSDTEDPSVPTPGGITSNVQSEVQRGGAGRRGSGPHHTPAGLVASLRGDSRGRERMYEPDEAMGSPTAAVDPRRRPGTSHTRSSSILLGGKRARPSSTTMAHPSTPWAVP